VGNYGKTQDQLSEIFCFFDMEGRGDRYSPYSATLVTKDFDKTWTMNPSPCGADATLEECKVYPKP
jgi:hypothetical protein